MIRDVGRFLERDAAGFFTSAATGIAIQDAWQPALDTLAEGCRSEVGDAFHSFYVRGSVACGTAVMGSSDLDTVLVLDDNLDERRPAWQVPLAARVLAVHPFITDVEVVVLGRAALARAVSDPSGGGPVMAQWCFLLALWGRCLEGLDVLPSLGRFRPGPDVAYVVRHLPIDLRVFEATLAALGRRPASETRDAELRKLCTWTCKKLLRAGAELAMLDDGRFTRDLSPCARRLGARFPPSAEHAQQLLRWAIAPPTELAPLADVVQRLEPILVDAARAAELVVDPA